MTTPYGDISASFYDSLVSVFRNAAELVERIEDPDVLGPFKRRMVKIIQDTSGMGWGFHDDLSDIYGSLGPPGVSDSAWSPDP